MCQCTWSGAGNRHVDGPRRAEKETRSLTGILDTFKNNNLGIECELSLTFNIQTLLFIVETKLVPDPKAPVTESIKPATTFKVFSTAFN